MDIKFNKIIKDFSLIKDQFKTKENALLKKQIDDLNNKTQN